MKKIALLSLCISPLALAVSGALTPLADSPFASTGTNSLSVAYSPNGNLVALLNAEAQPTISLYNVEKATGNLTEVTESPFAISTVGMTNPLAQFIQFSSDGRFIAVALNEKDTGTVKVAVLEVDFAASELSNIANSPFDSGIAASDFAFLDYSDNGKYLAVTGSGKEGTLGAISTFAVDKVTGALQLIVGSPYSVENATPLGVAYSPTTNFLAVAFGDQGVAIFPITQTGQLGTIVGPFDTLGSTFDVAYASNEKYLATANQGGASYDQTTMFAVDKNSGGLTPINSYQTGGVKPVSVEFSPGNGLVMVLNSETQNISVFAVNKSTGQLTAIDGSPFVVNPDGNQNPQQATYSTNGRFVAVANFGVCE